MGGSPLQSTGIDNLSWRYSGNQLEVVCDNAPHKVYGGGPKFKDGTDQSMEYLYDANGSMTKDLNKIILNIIT